MNSLSTQQVSMIAEQPSSWSMAARDILPLICVREPYFAFQSFDIESQTVKSSVTPQHPLGNELGPIAAAEAGRHLAILGSCAAAMENPTRARHYYLAREAFIERSSSPVPDAPGELTASATASLVDKRNAQARCSISAGAARVFSLEVSYSVLSEALFQRFYGKHEVELDNVTPLQRENPYRKPLPFEVIDHTQSRLIATMGVVPKELCAGHFSKVPCLPVAVLMHALAHAAGDLLVRRAGGSCNYSIELAEVSARELAVAGTSVQLEANYVGQHPRGDKFHVRATSAPGKLIGESSVVLREAHRRS